MDHRTLLQVYPVKIPTGSIAVLAKKKLNPEREREPAHDFSREIHAHAVAGIQNWDLLPRMYLPYHFTYTSLVMEREIFSF